ncbi:MAG: hypothetical protein R3C49_14630 [Planctomycetaceae bacterium]
MAPTSGKSLVPVFRNVADRPVHREFVVFGKERHDVGRPQDQGYPMRESRMESISYQKLRADSLAGRQSRNRLSELRRSPTKTEILNARRYQSDVAGRWQMAFGKRPAEELYHISQDRYCMVNLAANENFSDVRTQLEAKMLQRLAEEQDPRLTGPADYFERLPYADKSGQGFYEKFLAGEKVRAGWVDPSDFEPAALDD